MILSLKSLINFIQISKLQLADNGLRGSNMHLWLPKCAHRLATTTTCCLPPIHPPARYNHAIFMHSAISIIEIAGVFPPLFVFWLCSLFVLESYQGCQLCQIVIFDRRFLVSLLLVFTEYIGFQNPQSTWFKPMYNLNISLTRGRQITILIPLVLFFSLRTFWFVHTIITCF